jgi:hypothetical protein
MQFKNKIIIADFKRLDDIHSEHTIKSGYY